MIIEPTRELALQLYDQGRKLADDTNVQVVKAYGEYDYKVNAREIFQGADIVVGTPGRLFAFLNDGVVSSEKRAHLFQRPMRFVDQSDRD